MKRGTRISLGAGCILLLLTAWIITVNAQSAGERQLMLISKAVYLMADGIYILAVPLLEEAAGYNAAHTLAAESNLKRAYLALIDNRGFRRRYTALLERQMGRRNAHSDIFAEAAGYHLNISNVTEALNILKTGIERTGCNILMEMYENNRYAYTSTRVSFNYVSAIYNGTMQVQSDGLWGIARANGTILIPCMYDKISTFCNERAIAKKDGDIFAVDRNNNRIALLRHRAADMGNLSENRISISIGDIWRRADGQLVVGSAEFEYIGTYSEGHAAAKTGGRWGVVDRGTNWFVPPVYDAIKSDELGRSYAQGAVFVVLDGVVYLIVEGRMLGGYEDARPFSSEGYAAVKMGGQWGFINTRGEVMIDFMFDDALSFGQHLAAVKLDNLWGYIDVNGEVVIEPVFVEAKSFYGGHAPALTERGWSIITLLEYK